MATGLGEDGRESSDGCRSRANKLAGAAFSLFMRCRTVVTSPPPATHACSRVAAVDALFHSVVGRCRRRRVAPRACAAPLGLEHRGVVRAWTTTRSRRVTRGGRPKELQFRRPPPGKLRLRRRPHRSAFVSATRHPGSSASASATRCPGSSAFASAACRSGRLRRRCRGPRATHHRGRTRRAIAPPPSPPATTHPPPSPDLMVQVPAPPAPPTPMMGIGSTVAVQGSVAAAAAAATAPSSHTVAVMVDCDMYDTLRAEGWVEMETAAAATPARWRGPVARWGVCVSDCPEHELGWGVRIGGTAERNAHRPHVEGFLSFDLGKGGRVQPGLVIAMDGDKRTPALVLRSSWLM
uniref:Uncharacterized protein n=1 Tax=Oryza barthii TaxID=65489 RepID=A0A0D3HE21_9ORYZ